VPFLVRPMLVSDGREWPVDDLARSSMDS
jgi:hypothetical protein